MSAGQIAGGIVGGVVGFFVGGPAGAAVGFGLGMAAGGMLDQPKGPTMQGPRLNDLSVQTSTYGANLPRFYGTIAVSGNITWLENNRLKETVRKKKSGGKGGGGGTTTKEYSYSATFILSIGLGPIAGVRRIWCADKLIYNAGSDDLETIIASNQAAKGFRIYLGTDDQLPDPRYEADVGVGNAPAFRGEAYIAFYDLKLADYSNTLQAAQFKVEVVSFSAVRQEHIYSTKTLQPVQAQAYFPGSAGGTSFDAYFAAFLFGPSGQYSLARSGVVSTEPFAVLQNIENYRPSDCASTDIARQVWVSLADGTERLVVLEGGSWKQYVTVSDFSNFNVIERSGHYWFQWSDDANSPDPSAGGTLWCAKFTEQPSPAGPLLAQGVKGVVLQSAISAASADGRFVSVIMGEIQSASTGSVSVTVYDENMASVLDGDIIIPPRSGDIIGSESSAYVDDNNNLHIVSVLYLGSGTPNYLYGKYFYTVIDLADISLVRTATLTASALTNNTYKTSLVRVEDGILYMCGITELPTQLLWRAAFAAGIVDDGLELLSNVIEKEVVNSGILSAEDIDTSGIMAAVRGYRISGGTIRSAIEPLQAAFPMDVRPHGYQIQFLPRGQASVVTIPRDDLGATDGNAPGDILRQSREMDTQLPARTAIKYLDAAREYAISEQYSERLNTEAINRVDRELPLVLSADEAARVAEVLNFLPWLERTDATFSLPPSYRYLEPGDVVTVETTDAAYELRLTDVTEEPDGRLECKARPSRAALYASTAAGAEGVPATGTIGLAGQSLFVPLDIPVIDETLQDAPGFVGVMTGYTGGWPGALALRSGDGGQTWEDLQAYPGKASVGTVRGTLPASACTLIDQRTLVVDMISGDLESVTSDQMLAGVNYAAYGVDGRWEVVRFQNATLQADGSYLLSGFVRGDRGTEWATGLHAAGDYFIVLDDPDNAFIGMAVGSIAAPATYRGVTSGADVDSAVDVPFTYRGVNLECLSPAYPDVSRNAGGDMALSWTRRSRLSSSWWATGTSAPLGEASESYEVDILSGSTVVRTIASSTPSIIYTAAQQTADFGSLQASIATRIYQLSAVVGRGYALEVTA